MSVRGEEAIAVVLVIARKSLRRATWSVGFVVPSLVSIGCFGFLVTPPKTVPFPEAKMASKKPGWSCYDQEGDRLRTICRPTEDDCKTWRFEDEHAHRRVGSCEPKANAACFYIEDDRYNDGKELACFGTLAQCNDLNANWRQGGVKAMSDCKEVN